MLDRWASQSPASVPMDNLSEKAKNAQVGCWECSVFPKMVENEPCQISQKNVFIYPLHTLQKSKLYDPTKSTASHWAVLFWIAAYFYWKLDLGGLPLLKPPFCGGSLHPGVRRQAWSWSHNYFHSCQVNLTDYSDPGVCLHCFMPPSHACPKHVNINFAALNTIKFWELSNSFQSFPQVLCGNIFVRLRSISVIRYLLVPRWQGLCYCVIGILLSHCMFHILFIR